MNRGKILFVALFLFIFSSLNSRAWKPEGWVYHHGDYAYSSAERAWYFASPGGTQRRVNLGTGQWSRLPPSPSGWMYYAWPYAYSSTAAAWYWHKPGDTLWCCKLGFGAWSLFGVSSIAQFAGTWSGSYAGDETGTWNCTITPSGTVSGVTHTPEGDYTLSGTVTREGDMTATAGDVTTGATFEGQMKTGGTVHGTWVNPWYRMDGTFTGNRQ
jgi:hypothetical protein